MKIGRISLLVGAALLTVSACASPRSTTQAANGSVASPASVGVDIENNNFSDVDVYVVSEGLATRLGTVTGNTTAHYNLDPSFLPTDQLRLVATPIGGNGRASSGPLNVSPGQTIHFTVAPRLRQSFADVR
jgi:hypothetical protein